MQEPPTKLSTNASPWSDHIIRGTIYGLVAAVGYTAANVFLRSSIDVHPYWVSGVKALPTVLIFGPWLLARIGRSQRVLPPGRALAWLVAAAIMGQLGGNVVFQWSLGVIGIALTVPLCLGAMILTGAAAGWVTLREEVTLRTAVSIIVLIAAIGLLSLGAPTAHASLAKAASQSSWEVALGVSAACFAGVSYALLGVAIRSASQHGCPAVTTVVTVGLAGVMILWPLAAYRIGLAQMWNTDTLSMTRMVAAGLANAVAFVSLTKSLQLIGVVYVNALNATQAAMAAAAGVVIFQEPLSGALGAGVLLTALGLLLMKRRPKPDFSPDNRDFSPKNEEALGENLTAKVETCAAERR